MKKIKKRIRRKKIKCKKKRKEVTEMSSMVLDPIKPYLASKTLRSLNRQLRQENSAEYCKRSAFIYQDDFAIINKQPSYAIMYHDDDITYGLVYKSSNKSLSKNNNEIITYKLKQINDTFKLTIGVESKLPIYENVDDIDLQSKLEVLVSRGCEDYQSDFAKQNLLSILKSTFDTYFQPDDMYNILYLYTYLHSNAVLLNYQKAEPFKHRYSINKLPPQSLLNDLYNLYNLLYVHVSLIQ